MAGSIYGRLFQISTWGESHGPGIGVVIDGCPAGLSLSAEHIQAYLDRRKPGQSKYTTMRKEDDSVEILSGVFEGITTGTPISLLVRNEDQRSRDYGNIAHCYRPGHADYTFDRKYGHRDYRGGGRSSGRETIARVAAGAVASRILASLGIQVQAYTSAIGPYKLNPAEYDFSELTNNPFYMPDKKSIPKIEAYLAECMSRQDSAGGIVECQISGLPAGLGDPVFEKLDSCLAKAVMSIGAVKGFEVGNGFQAAFSCGSSNNDSFYINGDQTDKKTNHSGGTLGGMSDGSNVLIRAAFKPTPSISSVQHTVTDQNAETDLVIHGRHDPIIVPRAVVVVEAMAAITVTDLLFTNMSSQMDSIIRFYK